MLSAAAGLEFHGFEQLRSRTTEAQDALVRVAARRRCVRLPGARLTGLLRTQSGARHRTDIRTAATGCLLKSWAIPADNIPGMRAFVTGVCFHFGWGPAAYRCGERAVPAWRYKDHGVLSVPEAAVAGGRGHGRLCWRLMPFTIDSSQTPAPNASSHTSCKS